MIQIISPHIDDAILSLGGFIDKQVKKHEIAINYIFSVSDWTNSDAIIKKDYVKDKVQVSKLRKKEEQKISELLGYRIMFHDFEDFPLRCNRRGCDDDWLFQKIVNALVRSILKTDICVFPIGQKHPDHEIIGRVSNRFLKLGYNVLYYEDLPYIARYSHDYNTTFSQLQKDGFSHQNFEVDIEKKISILRFYESQMSEEWLNCVKAYSYSLLDSKCYERLWSLHLKF